MKWNESRKGKILFAIVALAALTSCSLAGRQDYPSHTVESVDLQRYVGKWYEIASFPAWFQKGCTCTTAQYTIRSDTIGVINRCREGSPKGEIKESIGKAWAVPGTRDSQLIVQFMWPFRGDYWIIGLDKDYRFAIVGHPAKDYLWILAREPRIDEKTYRSLVEIAKAKGYDVSRLQRTVQDCDE